MDEQTTTANEPEDQGAEQQQQAQPEAPATEAAATEPNEQQTQEAAEPSEPQDDNLDWLKSKGVDPNSPEALAKVADMYRNAEKAMHQSTAKASELEKSLTTDEQPTYGQSDDVQALAAEVQNMKLATKVNTFFSENPQARELESEMTKIVTERPEIGQMVKSGYLDLQDVYNLAAANPNREKALKTEGGREALQKVADKQLAKSVPGQATSSEFAKSVSKENVSSWWDNLGPEGRAKPENRAELDRILNS